MGYDLALLKEALSGVEVGKGIFVRQDFYSAAFLTVNVAGEQ